MTLHLHVLGSGTAIPHPSRGASGYALVVDDVALLLECGPGSTRRWPSAGLDFASVRAIAVSHHHVDHCGDLPAVLFGRNVPRPPVETPLALVGPLGHTDHVAAIEAMYGRWVEGAHRVVELKDGGGVDIGPFAIDARVVRHSEGALGFRIKAGGRTIAFSGDSGPCDALTELCRGVDVALVECSFPGGTNPDRHLDATSAGTIAMDADVSRLVLTHFYPECDGVDIAAQVRRAGYSGELVLAEDGLVVEV